MYIWITIFLGIVTSFLLTWLLRRYALAKSVMDIPNARSSHSIPTPRGGGGAIVISFLAALPIFYSVSLIKFSDMWALLIAGLGVAVVGFLDDHKHIAARWRLIGHLLGAIWILFWFNGLHPLKILGVEVNLSWIGNMLAVVYLIWMLNLYNFMDGIDGLASVEAITVCIGGAILYLCLGKSDAAMLPILLASTVVGFLLWNFPPAKIFMGDAGSGFLGLMLAAFSLQAGWVAPELFWSWIILLGVFVVDATVTLLHRLMRGEKVYEAHRSHAYQFAARHYGAHKPVTLAVLAINCLWLFPCAFIVAVFKFDGLVTTVIAYTPLVFLAIKFKAGAKENI